MDLEKDAAFTPASLSSLATWSMAILMISAAVPWIGVLMAVRSAKLRRLKFFAWMSGK